VAFFCGNISGSAEMTDKLKLLETLDPKAFVLALICAPILIGILGAWMLLIPTVAVLLGGPYYLIFGTPVLLWMVTRYPPDARIYACAGFLVQSALTVVFAVPATLTTPQHELQLPLIAASFGLVFAPLWTGTFAFLYRRWHRPTQLFPDDPPHCG
jgi:hypothetical protein